MSLLYHIVLREIVDRRHSAKTFAVSVSSVLQESPGFERHSSKPSNCLLTVRIAVFYSAVALFYNEDARNRRKRKRGNVRSCSSMLGICRISVSHVILSLFWCVFGLYDDFVFLFMTILVQRDLWKIPLHYFITCHYTSKNMSSAAFIGARTGQTSFIIVYVMYYIVI